MGKIFVFTLRMAKRQQLAKVDEREPVEKKENHCPSFLVEKKNS